MNKRLIGLAVLLAAFSSGVVLADDSTDIQGPPVTPAMPSDNTGTANGMSGGAGASKNMGPAEMDLNAPSAPVSGTSDTSPAS